MESFVKQPYEEWPISFDFSDRIPDGATITSATVTATMEDDGSNQTSNVLATAAHTITSPLVIKGVKGGTNRRNYKLTCRAVTDTGVKMEMDVLMEVRD